MTNVQLWQPKSAQNEAGFSFVVSVWSPHQDQDQQHVNQTNPCPSFCISVILLCFYQHNTVTLQAASELLPPLLMITISNYVVCVCVCVLSCRQIEFSSPVCRAAAQHLTSDPTYRCVCACMCIMWCTSAALFSPESYHLLPAQSHALINITLTYMLICGVSACVRFVCVCVCVLHSASSSPPPPHFFLFTGPTLPLLSSCLHLLSPVLFVCACVCVCKP